MKFTLSWLKEYLDTNATLEEISRTLTAIGLEVEEIIDRSTELAPFTVAEIRSAKPHPNADKLQVCEVDNGTETLQIVCGAPNARAGIKVVLAPVGITIPTNGMKIKPSKIRDVESNGMLCSATELGIGEDSAGIIELPGRAVAGNPFAPVLGLDDPLIEIAITPNRGDCLGVYGIARDLAAAGLGTLKPDTVSRNDFEHITEDGTFDSPITVDITTPACTYFIGRTIRGVTNKESPAWLKRRLESIGQKPISALVDITNYLTFAYGRPAHVYDANKLEGNIVVREAQEGESFTALNDTTYNLEPGMTAIADDSGAIGLGGIIGGTSTGCDERTTDVFLEVALFDPVNIATTGRKLQIDSDARYRFERTVPMTTLKHIITATRLITELCGGEASKPTITGSLPMQRHTILFSPEQVQQRTGLDIPRKDITAILDRLGFTIKDQDSVLALGVPFYRPDITIAEDVVEEIARIYGYDHIPATALPRAQTVQALSPAQRKGLEVRRLLATRGLREVVTFSFMAEGDAQRFNGERKPITLANPISAELSTMRPSILPNLVQAAKRNMARDFSSIALFESGLVFHGTRPEDQHPCISGIRTGITAEKNPYGETRLYDVFDAKADALAALSPYSNAGALQVKREAPDYYHPGRSGALCLGKNILGYFGELHPGTLKALGMKAAVSGFEIFPGNAPQPRQKPSAARPKLELSNYQSVARDFAFIVDEAIPAADILQAVRKAEKKLLSDVHVFDVYQGKGVEDGKKSVALMVTLQPKDKTLTDAEIEAVSQAIIAQVEQATGGQLRAA